jgi:hypothetical protein
VSFREPIIISKVAFLALWDDPSLTIKDIASRTGMGVASVGRIARLHGFPKRRMGRPPFVPDERFDAMWIAGVCSESMARYYDVVLSTIWLHARKRRLKTRNRGQRALMTVAQFLMRETARAEEAQFRLAEMVDDTARIRRAAA